MIPGKEVKPKRPVMRWFGGKWMLAPWILSHFPPHEIYVEPFGGAGSVLLRKPPSNAEVYNDLDGEIVNVFRVLQIPSYAAELRRRLFLTPFSRSEFRLAFEPAPGNIERARRLIIQAGMGFAPNRRRDCARTGFRASATRRGSIPAHDWKNYVDAIDPIVNRLRGVVIEERDAETIIKQHDRGDALFYVDPPYVHSTRDPARTKKGWKPNPTGYIHEMTDDDHRSLAGVLRGVQGKVIISGYPCDLYDSELYRDWRRVGRGAIADGGRKRREVLWMNFERKEGENE